MLDLQSVNNAILCPVRELQQGGVQQGGSPAGGGVVGWGCEGAALKSWSFNVLTTQSRAL